ncbi:LysR family transcriptional regulator [Nocardioides sp. CPCC 206347]|uniref:LysR family transcriptional regulator n=1 Tax=Nocardioides sp. CPCC 206347 TaxID=3406463 RepID=UPI003B43018D
MYELRHLQALDAIADEGTFGRAAARLGYTQSTLSQQIAALERTVGGAVFDRPGGPRPVRLTALGRLVLDGARSVLARSRSLGDDVARFHAGDGRIEVGTFQTVTNVLLPTVVGRLRSEHPGCDIRLFEDEDDTPDPGDLDVLFLDAPGSDGVDSTLILEDQHVLVARRGDFAAGAVALKKLNGIPMVALPAICDQGRVEEHLAEHGVAPHFVFRTADNQAVVSVVRAGLGCAIMPLLAITTPEVDDEVVLHPLRGALPPRQIYALTRGALSPLAQRLVAVAQEHGAELTRAGACQL